MLSSREQRDPLGELWVPTVEMPAQIPVDAVVSAYEQMIIQNTTEAQYPDPMCVAPRATSLPGGAVTLPRGARPEASLAEQRASAPELPLPTFQLQLALDDSRGRSPSAARARPPRSPGGLPADAPTPPPEPATEPPTPPEDVETSSEPATPPADDGHAPLSPHLLTPQSGETRRPSSASIPHRSRSLSVMKDRGGLPHVSQFDATIAYIAVAITGRSERNSFSAGSVRGSPTGQLLAEQPSPRAESAGPLGPQTVPHAALPPRASPPPLAAAAASAAEAGTRAGSASCSGESRDSGWSEPISPSGGPSPRTPEPARVNWVWAGQAVAPLVEKSALLATAAEAALADGQARPRRVRPELEADAETCPGSPQSSGGAAGAVRSSRTSDLTAAATSAAAAAASAASAAEAAANAATAVTATLVAMLRSPGRVDSAARLGALADRAPSERGGVAEVFVDAETGAPTPPRVRSPAARKPPAGARRRLWLGPCACVGALVFASGLAFGLVYTLGGAADGATAARTPAPLGSGAGRATPPPAARNASRPSVFASSAGVESSELPTQVNVSVVRAQLFKRQVTVTTRGAPEATYPTLPSAQTRAGRARAAQSWLSSVCPLPVGELRLASYPEGLLLALAKPNVPTAALAAAGGLGANTTWSTVCAQAGFGDPTGRTADVACRQLGYLHGAARVSAGGGLLLDRVSPASAHNAGGEGAAPAPTLAPLLSAVAASLEYDTIAYACNGRELALSDCSVRAPLDKSHCAHGRDDVVLRCVGGRDLVHAAREDKWEGCMLRG